MLELTNALNALTGLAPGRGTETITVMFPIEILEILYSSPCHFIAGRWRGVRWCILDVSDGDGYVCDATDTRLVELKIRR